MLQPCSGNSLLISSAFMIRFDSFNWNVPNKHCEKMFEFYTMFGNLKP